MTVHLQRKTFTVEEYHKLGEAGILKDTDHVELINGEIITMSPIRSSYAGMVDDLLELLIVKLYKKASIKGQNPIRLDEFSEPEPDIVIAKYIEGNDRSNHPTPKDIYCVIEVSDTTLEKDREVKHPLYATAGIPEYWIINLVNKQVEIHRQPKNGEYHFKQIISEIGEIICQSINLSIDYDDLFK